VINLCREIPGVQYLKEEKPPQGSSIGEVLRLAGPEVKGVFGGSCCYWIIAEHRRGVCGNMPGAYLADVDARIWDLLEAGDVEHARLVHQDKMLVEDAVRALPLLQGMKEVLVRRGVFTSACERNAAHRTVDPEDADELDRALEVVSRHFSP
jgi:4-hydroxy-tetrahydrodipicolinate synthase